MKIGFIGTGNMGNGMVRKLLRAGYETVIHDRRQEATANLIELGAMWAENPAAVAAQTEILFTSLPGPVEMDEASLGDGGILEGARDGLVHVDLTSSLPSAVKRLAQISKGRGVTYLEAPVSDMVSGPLGVEEERLTVFVGGDTAALERVRPMLETFSKNIFHTGPVGSGNVIKLTNNMISLGSVVLIQEAMAVAVKAGVDPMTVFDMWNVSSASRWVQGVPRMVESLPSNAPPTFTLQLSAKDIGYCLEMSRELGVPMTVGSAVSQVFTRTVAKGYGNLNPGATLLTIEEESGVKIRQNDGIGRA